MDPGAHKDAGAIVDTIISKAVNCACFVPTLLVEFVNYLERNPDEADEVQKNCFDPKCTRRCWTRFDIWTGTEVSEAHSNHR